MPDVRLIHPMEHEVGKCNGVDGVVLLTAIERPHLEGFKLVGRSDVPIVCPGHVFKRLRQKAARTAAGVINRFADLGVNHPHHGADDFARGKELAAVVPLLPHLEEEALVDLR